MMLQAEPDYLPHGCAECGELFLRHPAGSAGFCADCTSQRSAEMRLALRIVPGLADVLDDARNWLERFVAFPHEHGSTAVALWAAVTHCLDQFGVAPYLLITAPEIESGKTRVMEVAAPLCARPLFSSSMTPAVLYRVIEAEHPTLFLDEADNVWTGRRDDKSGELVALLNAGHRRGAKARRMGGPRGTQLEEFDVFGPKAMAGAFPKVSDIPEALRSRSIHLRMKRRLPGERIERWTQRDQERLRPEAENIADELAELTPQIGYIEVPLLESLSDRDFDVWEPLLTVAMAAGARWHADAIAAAEYMTATGSQTRPARIVVLEDIRGMWPDGQAFMHTQDILDKLHKLEERDWGDYYGSPLTARRLAGLLASFDVESKREQGEGRRKGYYRRDLEDPWKRYLTAPAETVSIVSNHSDSPDHGGCETLETFETFLGEGGDE